MIYRITKHAARLFLAVIVGLALLGSLPTTVRADGSVDLELGGEGATGWNVGGIKPGDSGTKTVTLHNVGSRNGFVTIWISDIVSSEGINPESETGDTSEPGELIGYLVFNLSCSRLSTNCLPTTIDNFPQSASDPNYIRVSPLNVGDTVTLDWQWELPIETGNGVQGDSLSFTINYMLQEFPPPPSGGGPSGSLVIGPIAVEEAPPPGTTDVRGLVSSTGRFTRSVTATSENGLCTLTIPEGTVGLTEDLEPLAEVTILIMDEPPPPPEDAHVVGLAYDFGPDGATFDPPITLTWSYDPADIPEGIAAENLVIAYYVAGEWIELEGCVVDTENNTITASVEHFTTFAIVARVPLPPPEEEEVAPPPAAFFSVFSLTIQPPEVEPGETVTISVRVANTGGESGSYTVVLKINGVKEAERRATIAPGSVLDVGFSITKDDPSDYSVAVDGLSATFTVVAAPEEVPEEEVVEEVLEEEVVPEEERISAKQIKWPLIGIIGAVVLVVGLITFYEVRRRARLTRR